MSNLPQRLHPPPPHTHTTPALEHQLADKEPGLLMATVRVYRIPVVPRKFNYSPMDLLCLLNATSHVL